MKYLKRALGPLTLACLCVVLVAQASAAPMLPTFMGSINGSVDDDGQSLLAGPYALQGASGSVINAGAGVLDRRYAVEFDFSALPALPTGGNYQWVVNSATVDIAGTLQSVNPGLAAFIYQPDGNGAVDVGDFPNSAAVATAPTQNFVGPINTPFTASFDFTGEVEDALNGTGLAGFTFFAPSAVEAFNIDTLGETIPPVLTLDAMQVLIITPEPSTFAMWGMLGGAAVCFGIMRRRRSRKA